MQGGTGAKPFPPVNSKIFVIKTQKEAGKIYIIWYQENNKEFCIMDDKRPIMTKCQKIV